MVGWNPLPFSKVWSNCGILHFSSVDLDHHTNGMLVGNSCRYMEDVQALDTFRPPHGASPEFVLDYGAHSPLILILSEWTALLANHPDQSFVKYIVEGIQNGFCIGFNRQHQLNTSPGSMPSSVPNIISEHLQRELSLGRMIKFPPYIFPRNIHTSPIGIIPKKNKPGKWR